MIPGRTERIAAAVALRHELSEAIRRLNEAGILPMPLKGVLLQHTVYADPSERIISEADLLVPTRRGMDALDVLSAHGYARDGKPGAMARSQDAQLGFDVRWRVFPTGLYNLRASEMFARGRIDEELFGAVVVVPDPLDVYAHLVGDFARGRLGAEHAPQIRDLSAVASKFSLAPRTLARHLERHGLARAARYTLGYAAASGDDHAVKVLRALRRDVVGRLGARVARGLTDRFGDTPGSALSPHLVNASLPRGVFSTLAQVAKKLNAARASDRSDDD